MAYTISDELAHKLAAIAQTRNVSVEQLLEDFTDEMLESTSFLADSDVEDESQFQSVVQSQLELICRYTPDTVLTFVNDAYCQFFNQRAEQLIGHSFLSLADSTEHASIHQRINELLADPSPAVKDYRAIGPDGRHRWIQWMDYGIMEGDKLVMIQAVGRDVTRLKDAQRHLASQEQYYRMLFDRNPLPMWVFDGETLAFLAVNDAAIMSYGYTRDEFLHMTIKDIRPPEHVPRLMDMITKPERGLTHTDQWQHRKKDGTIIDVDIVAHDVVFNERPARLVLANDITTRRQLEQERLYANSLAVELEKEREVIELKERFVSIVSHEFRTPLSVILSSVDIVRLYFDRLTRERIAEKLDGIADQVKHMVNLLDDVLMISRHNAQRVSFTPELHDIIKLLNTAIEHIRIADADRHRFVLNIQLTDPIIPADKRLLDHIFLNLIGNAVKYSPVGSSIFIDVTTHDQQVLVSVRDEGIGIPLEEQARMFEPFYRAKNAGDVSGTGLGLSIVKQSVDVHQGRLTFESQPGVGSVFVVHLPRHYNGD